MSMFICSTADLASVIKISLLKPWYIYIVFINNRNKWACNSGLDNKQEILKLLLMAIILGSLHIMCK